MDFKIGDKVIYPNHGLGVIEDIKDTPISGERHKFYYLRINSNETKVLVPTNKTEEVGLRRVIAKSQVKKLFKNLRNGKLKSDRDWKGRFQENSDRMRSGELFEVADVYKCLSILSKHKELSDREKRMMEKARYLIVSEVAEAEKVSESRVETRLNRAISAFLKNN